MTLPLGPLDLGLNLVGLLFGGANSRGLGDALGGVPLDDCVLDDDGDVAVYVDGLHAGHVRMFT